jgi:hypothetical protein
VLPLALLGDVLLTAGSLGAAFAAGKQLLQGWRAKSRLAFELSKDGVSGVTGPQAEASVRRVAQRLNPSDQYYVEAALKQGSERGKQNYIGDALAAAQGETDAARTM